MIQTFRFLSALDRRTDCLKILGFCLFIGIPVATLPVLLTEYKIVAATIATWTQTCYQRALANPKTWITLPCQISTLLHLGIHLCRIIHAHRQPSYIDDPRLPRTAPEQPAEDICSICWDDFSDPQMLVCRHVFCGRCLRKLARIHKSRCPLCRQRYCISARMNLQDSAFDYYLSSVIVIGLIGDMVRILYSAVFEAHTRSNGMALWEVIYASAMAYSYFRQCWLASPDSDSVSLNRFASLCFLEGALYGQILFVVSLIR